MNRIFAALLFISISYSGFAQNIPLYNWRSHVPYLQGMQVVQAGARIYCATQTGLFYFDKSDNTIHTLSKVDGYSDIFVKTLAYAPKHDILYIAYQDGNLDMVHAGKITNYNQLENQYVISNISFDSTETLAYFSLNSNGIYEWDIEKSLAGIGPYSPDVSIINHTVVFRDSLYECSSSGVKKINLNVEFKDDITKWETISTDSCGSIVSFNGRIVGAFQNGLLKYYNGITNTWVTFHRNQFHHRIQSIEAGNGQLVMVSTDSLYTYRTIPASSDSFKFETGNDAIADEQGTIWMAQDIYVLLNYKPRRIPGNLFYQPGGLPSTTAGHHAYGYHNQVWFSSGLIAGSGEHGFDDHGFYMYDGETWHNYNQQTNYGKNDNATDVPLIQDFMGMGVDSITGHLWIGALDSGVAEFDPASHSIINIYNARNTNKGLPLPPPSQSQNLTREYTAVSDVKFDHNDNMWVSIYNRFAQPPKNQLAEKIHNGGWLTYSNTGPMLNVNSLVVDNYDNIWLIDSRDNTGVVIYNPTTKKYVTLGTTAGQGGLPSAFVNCGVNDKNGEIWLGTTSGPCVYSDPGLLFGNTSYDVQRPYISAGSNAGYLLGSLPVTCIAVDGADRKWFGTNQGVWLTSPEGDKILKHFDITNSPLVTNQINAIAINGVTGEVFFVSDKGIVSYRDAATDGGDRNENVYAFPNPVRPGYSGPITIRGLVSNANVKITDVTGALVYETTALGGEATWNGRNFSGREANSGVYLVFITNSDGSQTAMTKILIVR